MMAAYEQNMNPSGDASSRVGGNDPQSDRPQQHETDCCRRNRKVIDEARMKHEARHVAKSHAGQQRPKDLSIEIARLGNRVAHAGFSWC
jgi:hypothetical protein